MHSTDSEVSCGGYCGALELLGVCTAYSVALVVNRLPTSGAVLDPTSRCLSFLAVAPAAPDSDAEEVAEEGDPVKTGKPSLTRSSTASTGKLAACAVYSTMRVKQLRSPVNSVVLRGGHISCPLLCVGVVVTFVSTKLCNVSIWVVMHRGQSCQARTTQS
jgi:hypothetical protein